MKVLGPTKNVAKAKIKTEIVAEAQKAAKIGRRQHRKKKPGKKAFEDEETEESAAAADLLEFSTQ